ncbi:hypothetical protein F4778DRAFT_731811 [Xylariomycetidae sp. FL2044]|nr:hypothetical protein F4778DRAFT_731811 [Xylariomycetidae sp. FL2044]
MADDNGPRLLAACWSLAVIAGIFLSLRIYCKCIRGRGLWWDDHLMTIAWVCLLISVAINSYIVSLGFGRHIDTVTDENLKTINLNTILVATFGIMATSLSKTSFAVTLYRIITNKWMKGFITFIIITINVTMNLVWIFGLSKCTPREKVWDSSVPGTCWDMTRLNQYQLFAAYYSSILDFVLAFLPWPVLMGMVMLRREKIGIAVAMSMGAIAGIAGIVKAVMVTSITSPDITYDRVDLTIWTLAEPAVTIMAASLPVLRMLYRELKSSGKSYFKSKSKGGTQTAKSNAHSRATRNYHGRNSVMILSTTGWQESQEALQDVEAGSDQTHSPDLRGIMKTEEINIQHSRLSKVSGDDPMELRCMEPAYINRRPDHDL